MSQNYKLRSDEIEENNLGKDVRLSENEQTRHYGTEGHIRNVSFILSNGEKTFLNYAYLISGRCSIGDDYIILKFTSETVILKGVRLNELYYDMMFHRPMEVVPTDARYNATLNKSHPIVNDIIITE